VATAWGSPGKMAVKTECVWDDGGGSDTGLDYDIGTVGKYPGPTMSEGPKKDGSKIF